MIWACRTLGQHTTTIHITRTNTHAHSFSCHVHLRSGLRHHMSSDYSCFLLSTIPYYTDYTVLEILKRHTTNSLPHWNSSWPLWMHDTSEHDCIPESTLSIFPFRYFFNLKAFHTQCIRKALHHCQPFIVCGVLWGIQETTPWHVLVQLLARKGWPRPLPFKLRHWTSQISFYKITWNRKVRSWTLVHFCLVEYRNYEMTSLLFKVMPLQDWPSPLHADPTPHGHWQGSMCHKQIIDPIDPAFQSLRL